MHYSPRLITPYKKFGGNIKPFNPPLDGTNTSSLLDITQVRRFRATGGIITIVGEYTIHTFLSNGTFIPFSDIQIEYIIVGGGGGGGGVINGGGAVGGGGGGGGVLNNIININYNSNGYNVVIGSGGSGGSVGKNNGVTGGDSTFNGLTAKGGGGGGAGDPTGTANNGLNGGCGGGGGGTNLGTPSGGIATSGQGFNGGNTTGGGGGGGGGGAASIGQNSPSGIGGNGIIFNGLIYSIGGFGNTIGITQGIQPSPQNSNTGNGGHGGFGSAGGNGGSGIVIIRYKSL